MSSLAASVRQFSSVARHAYTRQIKGRLSPTRLVPSSIVRPPYALESGRPPASYPPPTIHDIAGQQKMRDASSIARAVLAHACDSVEVGMTTDDLDRIVHDRCIQLGVYPSPLHYAGFPKSVCTSINEVICHGIPDLDATLRKGDLLKLDVSVFHKGVHGDTCRTVVVGGSEGADAASLKLVRATWRSLRAAIAICGPGVAISKIGATIEPMMRAQGYGIIREFAGHGISSTFHTEPLVYHHTNGSIAIMKPGMTFTIEPMISEGSPKLVMWPDRWTVVTQDGSRAAQFEHTLLITEHGVEVLTEYDEGEGGRLQALADRRE